MVELERRRAKGPLKGGEKRIIMRLAQNVIPFGAESSPTSGSGEQPLFGIAATTIASMYAPRKSVGPNSRRRETAKHRSSIKSF